MKIFAVAFALSLFASSLGAVAAEVRPDTFYIQLSNHTGEKIHALVAGVGRPVGVVAEPDETTNWETFSSTQSSGSLSYACGGRGRSGVVWLKLSQPHIMVTILSNCENKVTYS